jgi:D-sedoheptulose 7-phosphate isomerase
MLDEAAGAAHVVRVLRGTAAAHERAATREVTALVRAATVVSAALRAGRKVLVFGNGGSAADAQHVVAELVGRFVKERRALAALALSTDASILTAVGNDYAFARVFSRQIEALGQAGDVAMGITTSGGSANVNEAFREARARGLATIAFTGRDGGESGRLVDVHVNVAEDATPRVQEVQITLLHTLCELVEDDLEG